MDYIQSLKDTINNAIVEYLPNTQLKPNKLHEAMHYSVLNGGKRVRALLVCISAKLFPQNVDPLPAAIAIELIHAYSLIHDDLPAMDDSATRRGRPSCHMKYDEATAILAGDALLTEAFFVLSNAYSKNPSLALSLIKELSFASGSRGMIAGQQEDVDNEGQAISQENLEFIHQHKTARLIQCAIKMGFLCGDYDHFDKQKIDVLGYHLGMAFQYQDDLLDVESDEETLGKPTQSDGQSDKLNAIKVYGIEEAKTRLNIFFQSAETLMNELEVNTSSLQTYVESLRQRKF